MTLCQQNARTEHGELIEQEKNMPKKYWKRPKTDVWEKQESTNDLAIREEREKNMSQAMLIQMETNLKFDLHNWEHILID